MKIQLIALFLLYYQHMRGILVKYIAFKKLSYFSFCQSFLMFTTLAHEYTELTIYGV